jgi:antitoxin Phd
MSKPTPEEVPASWKMEDAKAQFSRLAKLAREVGPQRVTHRGQDSVVVVAAAEFDRLAGSKAKVPLSKFFSESPLRHAKFGRIRVRSPIREPEF